jgi:hypothetical protein
MAPLPKAAARSLLIASLIFSAFCLTPDTGPISLGPLQNYYRVMVVNSAWQCQEKKLNKNCHFP